tara:strand:+ start:272 stop:1051 length:780 start_codon:yes stop_codon:yes gene_type:complete
MHSPSTNKIIKVLFGIPNEGHTECQAYDNRLEMCFHLGNLQTLSHFGHREYGGTKFDIPDGVEYQFSIASVGQVLTPLAREHLAEHARDEGFDYLFMVDDDMLTPLDLFEQLVKHDVDIIAPLAFSRSAPHKPVIYNLEKGWDNMRQEHFYVNHVVPNYPKDKLVKCDAVGFGAVLIKTKVLKSMAKPYFMSTTGAGEDIWFCHKAGENGFGVYMDTACKLGHLGYPKVITEAVYEAESDVNEMREERGDLDKYNKTTG